MSATQFKNDLTQPGTTEEPRSASNAGMNFALILTLVLSLVFVLWALAISNHDSSGVQSPTEQFDGQLNAPSSTIKTPHTTYFNGRKVSSDNDKSYVGGTETQAAPPSVNVPYGQ
jgi:hypothetical protein